MNQVFVLLKRKWITGLPLILAVVLLGRIVYVNLYYPQTKLQTYKLGETIDYQELQIVCQEIQVYTDQEFITYLKQNNSDFDKTSYDNAVGTQDYYIYLVHLQVTNTSGEDQTFTDSKASFCVENVISNGFSTYITKLISDGTVKSSLKPGESKEIEIAYQISKSSSFSEKQFVDLVNQKCSVSFQTFYCMNQVIVEKAAGNEVEE